MWIDNCGQDLNKGLNYEILPECRGPINHVASLRRLYLPHGLYKISSDIIPQCIKFFRSGVK